MNSDNLIGIGSDNLINRVRFKLTLPYIQLKKQLKGNFMLQSDN